MKTAKEWLEHLAKQTGQQVERYEGGVSCTVDTQELIARDIEVLEKAASSVLFLADNKQGERWNAALMQACAVLDDRIAELKAELAALQK
jgi:hypothetical protein